MRRLNLFGNWPPLKSLGVLIASGIVLAAAAACQPAGEVVRAEDVRAPEPFVQETSSRPSVPFVEIGAASGLNWRHDNGADGQRLLPETMGGGIAVLDVEPDGDADLLFVGAQPWPESSRSQRGSSLALFLNDGAARFAEATRQAGLKEGIFGMGCAVGDADNDGDPDVYVTAVGRNRLYRNDSGRFVDVTDASRTGGDPRSWSSGAGFFDADNDGDLDLFVLQYVRWNRQIDLEVGYTLNGRDRAYGPPMSFGGAHPKLFRNDGDLVFTDVSSEAGLEVENPHTGHAMAKGLGLTFADVDRDGLLDILVANDTVQNMLFHNLGGCRFAETGVETGLALDANGRATGAMGLDAADYRDDGCLGVVVGNFANEMTSLYVQQGAGGGFADEAIIEGIGSPSRTALSFGVFFFDADLDGRLDLLQVNGHLEETISEVQASQRYRQSAQLFWNTGGLGEPTFLQVPAAEIGDLARPVVGRGAAAADLDGDGDEDLIIVDNGGMPLVLRNDQETGHSWLKVRLEGALANRDAIGAEVELEVGGWRLRRRVMPTRGYLSQMGTVLTFGLGRAESIDGLTVRWPGGGVQRVPVDGVNRLVEVRQNPPG